MTTFGEKLRELRDAAGMTQTAMSEAAGVPIGTVRDYEQGRTTRCSLTPSAWRRHGRQSRRVPPDGAATEEGER